ncbi:MAG: hypothetical protein KDC55_12490 [Ignavibacteriae bacterium]|nr:hypothetical protein [Flavobacteriaceae bacterium]MCB0703516.1 hypothetical protein [Ignavibacteriota bacterium]
MKDKLIRVLRSHKNVSLNAKIIYIADYKDYNGGEVVAEVVEPIDIGYVELTNSNTVSVECFLFGENCLQKQLGVYFKQCEGMIFPSAQELSDWVLFIETKYANSIEVAFKKEYGYPRNMVDQILSTVSFCRNKGVLDPNRRVNAIVSFPSLISYFDAFFFQGMRSAEEILRDEKILIRPTNKATIISSKRIYLK